MQPYANLGGDSGVRNYELSQGKIIVKFSHGAMYTYTDASAGSTKILKMHELAKQGYGLNGFIMRNAKTAYESKSQ